MQVIVVGRSEDVDARAYIGRLTTQVPLQLSWVEISRAGHVAPVYAGLQRAGCDIVAFLDDDCEPEPTWLSNLVKPFADPGVACAGDAL